MYEEEIVKYKKKKSQKSKSSRKSDHKHTYEKVIAKTCLGWAWRDRCSICGKTDNIYGFGFDREFMKKEHRNSYAINKKYFLTLDEMIDLYPGVKIYDLDETTMIGGGNI